MDSRLPYKLKIEATPRWWRRNNWVTIAEFRALADAVEAMHELAALGFCVEIINGRTIEDQVLHDH